MTLTAAQQKLVEDNLGLVGKVIAQKVHGLHNIPYYTEDFITCHDSRLH